jgi:hypothetical protein
VYSKKEMVDLPKSGKGEITVRLQPAGKALFKLIEPSGNPLTEFPYMAFRLKQPGKGPVFYGPFGTRNGTINFFDGESGHRSTLLDTLPPGEYQADIRIYQQKDRHSINFQTQNPLYHLKRTFTIQAKKTTQIEIDMNKPSDKVEGDKAEN